MFNSLAVNGKTLRKQCWYVLFAWLLCTFSTALLASSPNTEQRDGYIALCTAQGIKWIPVGAMSAEIDDAPLDNSVLSIQATDNDNLSPQVSADLFNKHASQHCTACVLSTGDGENSTLVVSSTQFYVHLDQPSRLDAFEDASLTNEVFLSHNLSRAPPLIRNS